MSSRKQNKFGNLATDFDTESETEEEQFTNLPPPPKLPPNPFSVKQEKQATTSPNPKTEDAIPSPAEEYQESQIEQKQIVEKQVLQEPAQNDEYVKIKRSQLEELTSRIENYKQLLAIKDAQIQRDQQIIQYVKEINKTRKTLEFMNEQLDKML
ncbi:hypothetical protein WA158_004128 [Blastocystis sp. Blastoise]